MRIQLAYFNLVITISYSAAMFLAIQTMREIRKQSSTMSLKTRSLQAQLSRTLMAQV
jgi:hypothetical protein